MVNFILISQPQVSTVLPGDMVPATVALHSVDWNRYAALVVDMGEKRTGGYSVEVLDVRAAEGQVELQIKVNQPGPRAFVPQVLTHPYAVCTVDRTLLGSGPVTVVAHDQAGNTLARQVIHS